MNPRTKYKMTQADLDAIIMAACKSVFYIGCGTAAPTSLQDNVNCAWTELGKRMGFDSMTVEPDWSDMLCFTAVPNEPTPPLAPRPEAETPTPETDAEDFCQWCYDKGLRYSRGPWLHGVVCPFAPQKPEAKTIKEVLEIASIEDRYLPLLRIATKAEMERDALRQALEGIIQPREQLSGTEAMIFQSIARRALATPPTKEGGE